MRGTLLMSFLCALLSPALQTDYSWTGTGTEGSNPDKQTAPENICLTDAASCGCCVMEKQMWRLEHYFNLTLLELKKGLDQAQASLNIIKASRSAFSVALTDTRRCLGPERDEVTVIYQSVFINLGGAYSTRTGVFTAPQPGVYSLALTVYSDAGSPSALLAACATLTRNGQPLAALSEKNNQDQEDSATVVLAAKLAAGDTVAVRLQPGCFLCDDQSHYNTFSGFLLFPTS
ncbi:cerebellin 20 [Lepisosteus oculatus]|uniref:Cerebellin 20 n=1 Tax=Lepisosteus oculatus TaxID=7918 RepID=W5MH06_LEPOC|nr:PREDICTED: cerebellin-4-like [Lepisosteus oculatus]